MMNTRVLGVQKSIKGSATVEELVISKVARVGCEISLNRTSPSKIFMTPKGARDKVIKSVLLL